MAARQFLYTRILELNARARRLARIDAASVGIRPQDRPFAPSAEHFQAANQRLAAIDQQITKRIAYLMATWQRNPLERVLIDIALVEREVDRARRAFGLFFEMFSQRGSVFAPALAANDLIAADCYQAVRDHAPRIFRGRLLKPLSYMEHGFSPATMRRGVLLSRLLGEPNPFPIVRIPWDRDNPWQPVILHEVAHNLQADLGIWQENRQAVVQRILRQSGEPLLTRTYGVWHKEIFADLAAILLGGPAAAWGMAKFLAHPAPRTLTFRPGGAHPTAYLRVHMLAEMLRRLGFEQDAQQISQVWDSLYNPRRFNRLPARLLATSSTLIPAVVDEIAFQTRRNLAHRALADIIPFTSADEQRIKASAQQLIRGHAPAERLAPRHMVSAASYALASGQVPPRQLSERVIGLLNRQRQPMHAATLAADFADLVA